MLDELILCISRIFNYDSKLDKMNDSINNSNEYPGSRYDTRELKSCQILTLDKLEKGVITVVPGVVSIRILFLKCSVIAIERYLEERSPYFLLFNTTELVSI